MHQNESAAQKLRFIKMAQTSESRELPCRADCQSVAKGHLQEDARTWGFHPQENPVCLLQVCGSTNSIEVSF